MIAVRNARGAAWAFGVGACVLAVGSGGCSLGREDAGENEAASPVTKPQQTRGPIVAQSYADTCTAEPQICSCTGDSLGCTGSVPEAMRRPLQLAPVGSDGRCPVTQGGRYEGADFAGIRLGSAPVGAIISPSGPAASSLAKQGVLVFERYRKTSWYAVKTLWFSEPDYQGPVLMRAGQLDGERRLAFGEEPASYERQIPPGSAVSTEVTEGFRSWPGGMYVKAPGCYGVQVDGETFSSVIAFSARLRN